MSRGPRGEKRPADMIGAAVMVTKIAPGESYERICGAPNAQYTSTSMRMQMRRLTRLTNGCSKKFDNHCHALALYFAWYNFVNLHKARKRTPAMTAEITDKLWSVEDLVALVEAHEPKRVSVARTRIELWHRRCHDWTNMTLICVECWQSIDLQRDNAAIFVAFVNEERRYWPLSMPCGPS